MRDILGGKGAGLAEMANLGLPVPPGFTISAKLCIAYLEHGTFPDDLREEVDRHLKQLERSAKKRFGDARNPLLVSVRSGAAVSMPGCTATSGSIRAPGSPSLAAAARAQRCSTAACSATRRVRTSARAPALPSRSRGSSAGS